MLFNSIPFLFFFALVYTLYWTFPNSFRKPFLLFAGLFFYGSFNLSFLIHFILIISFNYYCLIQVSKKKQYWLKIGVIANIINLGFFKYFYFFNRLLADLTGYPFFENVPQIIHIALPLSISFYSFQAIASLVDQAREDLPIPSYLDYSLFLAFFPVLIAGPIMRRHDFFPNLENFNADKEKIYKACYFLMSGLVKKVLVADPMSTTITPIFSNPTHYDGISLFLAGICYSIQVYCDFSGLTDMARSLAYFLGFEIPENFKGPFFSLTGRELWRRWHITLSFWLRDYIYFPLGGSRLGKARTYINLIIIMTVGGFWHGADYTFICWGFYWGCILALEKVIEDKLGWDLIPQTLLFKWIKAFLIFVLFSISGLMFRSNSARSMVELFQGIVLNSKDSLSISLNFTQAWILHGGGLLGGREFFSLLKIENLERVAYMGIALIIFHHIQYFPEKWATLKRFDPYLCIVCGVISIFLLATLSHEGGEFIYYKF